MKRTGQGKALRDVDVFGGAPRFYLAPEHWPTTKAESAFAADAASSAEICLEGTEAAHCRVLRLAPGALAYLMDGCGRLGRMRLLDINRKGARFALLGWSFHPRPVAQAVIALALSKAVRRGFFLEKAAELGAAGIWLWQGDYSQGRLCENQAKTFLGQLIAGAKQCGNPWLPEVRLLKGLEELCTLSAQADWRLLPWEAQEDVPMLAPEMAGRAGRTIYVIGPEGGFSPRELAALRAADFTAVSLGGRILRCETAAALCLGIAWWASQLPGAPDFQPPQRLSQSTENALA